MKTDCVFCFCAAARGSDVGSEDDDVETSRRTMGQITQYLYLKMYNNFEGQICYNLIRRCLKFWLKMGSFSKTYLKQLPYICIF